MSTIPPPPVPKALREMLKDYPEHIQTLQERLNRAMLKRSRSVPPFEEAVWALEDAIGAFIPEARRELETAKAGGDPKVIEEAKKKDFAVGSARLDMGDLSDLREYLRIWVQP